MPADESDAPALESGHRELSGQPHSEAEGRVAEAEAAAARISTDQAPMGTLGPRFNWRSPFLIGMTAAGGVAVTVGLIVLLLQAGSVLVLIGLSLFLAVGMEPAVSSLVRHHLPRWSAVTAVLLVVLAVVTAFAVSASAALVSQGQDLVKQIPTYLQQAQDHQSLVGQLNNKFGVQAKLQSLLDSSGSDLATGVLGAGQRCSVPWRTPWSSWC